MPGNAANRPPDPSCRLDRKGSRADDQPARHGELPGQSILATCTPALRIDEAFKRIKYRLNLEQVSGLSQQAVMQDFAAKVVCDSLHALTMATTVARSDLPAERQINRSSACAVLKPVLLLGIVGADKLLQKAMACSTRKTHRYRPDKSKPRPKQSKPHKSMTQKPW
jgi:hypothetical protein